MLSESRGHSQENEPFTQFDFARDGLPSFPAACGFSGLATGTGTLTVSVRVTVSLRVGGSVRSDAC